MALKVNEIFYSIQGESSYAGRPCVFVRLTGCNLRCSYCDTRYAYEEGEDLEIEAIISRVRSYRCPLVEVTGGEPLMQAEASILISRLLDEGYEVLLETNGSHDIGRIDHRCVRIVDIKCPSSGQAEHNDLENLARLTEKDELKFVIETREDYEYAKRTLELVKGKQPVAHRVHFSPVFGKLAPESLAGWILEDRLEARLHLQLHKIIWPPDRRGV
jgi:7-carboxy-7-deazaguanine synthase